MWFCSECYTAFSGALKIFNVYHPFHILLLSSNQGQGREREMIGFESCHGVI